MNLTLVTYLSVAMSGAFVLLTIVANELHTLVRLREFGKRGELERAAQARAREATAPPMR